MGDLPGPGTEPVSPALVGRFFTTEPPEMPVAFCNHHSDLLFCVPHLILKNLWLRLATQILQNSLAHHPVS